MLFGGKIAHLTVRYSVKSKAVDCLSRATALDPKYRELATTDSGFDAIQSEEGFRAAVND